MAIESYAFGRVVINGQAYTSDVIIYPHRVKARWWRKEGHRLQPGDLEEVVKEKPEILVVGTGYFGHMKVPPETSDYLRSQGVEVIAERTQEAWQTYNRLSPNRKVVAALHLTC
jgi:hypothetical protein